MGEVIAIGQIPQRIFAVLHRLLRNWFAIVEVQLTHHIVARIQEVECILPRNLRHRLSRVVQRDTCTPRTVAVGHLPAEAHGCALVIHQHAFHGHIQRPDSDGALAVLLPIQAGLGHNGCLTLANTSDDPLLIHLGNAGILGGIHHSRICQRPGHGIGVQFRGIPGEHFNFILLKVDALYFISGF